MVALVVGAAYRGQVRRRPPGRQLAPCTPTRRGSDGGADRRRPRAGRRPARARGAIVFVGFMGAGKRAPRARLPPSCGWTPSTPTASSRRSSASRWKRSSTARASRRFAARGGDGARRARRAASGGVVALGGGAAALSGCVRLSAATRSFTSRCSPGRPGAGPRARDGLWRAIAAGSNSCTPIARAVYESVAHAVLPPAGRDVARRALERSGAAR